MCNTVNGRIPAPADGLSIIYRVSIILLVVQDFATIQRSSSATISKLWNWILNSDWLVVFRLQYPSEKYEFVSWDDDIPN
jgi:hypothetical protein